MAFGSWFGELPFSISKADPRGESSTGPRATSSGAGDDDNNQSSEGQNQEVVVFDPTAARVVLPMEPEPAYTIFAGQELPQLPQPYVNPLAGMIDRPDPGLSKEERRDAYAKMMERFQVEDPEAPLEPKSYWSSETGPVTREHFNEYKAWTEEQIRKGNTLALESASTLWKQSHELAREKALREDTERKLGAQTVVQPVNVDRWMSEDRGALRKPRYTDLDNTEEREAERGQFLYENRSWRMKELRVTTLLLRAQVAVENEEPSKALDRLYEAQKLAIRFQFPALEARCDFWRGRAEFCTGSYDTALAAFQKALPCEGAYREGLEVRDWIRRAQSSQGNPPEAPTRTRSLRRRTRPDSFIGGAEHPPRFDLIDDSDDDGDDDGDHNTRERSPGFGIGDEPKVSEPLNPGGYQPRFSMDDEFEEGEEEKYKAGVSEDNKIIQDAMRNLEFRAQEIIGGRAGGSTFPEIPLGGWSSTERTTATADNGKGRATEDDFSDEGEQDPPASGPEDLTDVNINF